MPNVEMKIQYITTDFEFESTENLNPNVQEIGEKQVPQLNQWVDGNYRVSFSGTGTEIYDEPEQTINEFCSLIENLSQQSQKLWHGCIKRVADIAFESGVEPNYVTYQLPENLIGRLEKLKIGISITIYSIEFHYQEKDE